MGVDEKIEVLCSLIQVFDGLSVLRRYKVERIGNLIERINDSEIKRIWKKLKKDVEKMVYYPLTLPKVLTLIKLGLVFKIISPLSLLYTILGISYLLHPKLPKFEFFNLIYLIISLLISAITGIGVIITDYLVRIIVVKHEAKTDEFVNFQQKMKKATQKLIAKLIKELKKSRVISKRRCTLELYRRYHGINPIKVNKKHMKIFPRRYETYVYEFSNSN